MLGFMLKMSAAMKAGSVECCLPSVVLLSPSSMKLRAGLGCAISGTMFVGRLQEERCNVWSRTNLHASLVQPCMRRRCGGRGAILSGLFQLGKGQRLRVLAGGMSACGPAGNSGGGGGTYVIVEDEDEPLIVAGGGGGTRCACAAALPIGAHMSGCPSPSLCMQALHACL